MFVQKMRSGAVVLAAMIAATSAASGAPKVRVLLLSGRNNHDWRTTTPALAKLYEASGRFAVTVTNEPEKLDAAAFRTCDAIVSNWTPWPNIKQRVWDAGTEKAFLDFVRSGGGMVVFHAASTACQSWPEFQQIIGATWGMGKTGHGRRHEFAVKVADEAHPVTAGMGEFRIFDELWHRMAAQPKATVLATAFSAKDRGGSGADEPVAFCTRFGQGRGFNLVLGHDTKAMGSPGWQALMLRGTEWAATGQVTLPAPAAGGAPSEAQVDAALKAVRTYRFGQSRKPLAAVEKLVYGASRDPAARKRLAAKLAAMLASDVSPDVREFVCGQLSLIGGEAEVPVLAALLTDEKLSQPARSALERIPGAAALAALRAALGKAKGGVRVGLIGSLGERRDAGSAAALGEVLGGKDLEAAAAAVDALGKIGGEAALDALVAAKAKLPQSLRTPLARAMLRCAEGLLAEGKSDRAAAVFRDLSDPAQPKHIRVAAFPGRIATQKQDAARQIAAALSGDDSAMQRAAVRAVRIARDPKLLGSLAAGLAALPPPARAALIETLGRRRVTSALPAIAKEASSRDATVRRAALAALGEVGNASTVGLLAKLAAGAEGTDRQIARAGLQRLRGDDVDPAMVQGLKSAPPAVRRELIAALRQRGARSAVEAFLAAAGDADAGVRSEAVKGLGQLADLSALPAVLARLGKVGSDADRWNLEQALAAICRRGGAAKGTDRLLGAVDPEDAAFTGSLLRVLARLGGPKALREIRNAAASKAPDLRAAGIRALAEWPDAAPLEDLLALAESSGDPVSKVLALRGFVGLSARAADRKPPALAKLYARAMAAADRAQEKRALLGGLAGVHCPEALRLACGCLTTPGLANEAGLAAVKIADALWKPQPREAKAALERVLASSAAPSVRAEATRVLIELSKPRNLALDAKATSPDGLEKDGAAGGDQAAIDGKPATYWDEANGQKLYRLVVTFPEPRRVAVVRILSYEHHSYAPKDFDILCDGKVAKAVRNAQYDDRRLTVAFPPVPCTSVELKITGCYGASPAVREMEIYGLDPAKQARKAAAIMTAKPSYTWSGTETSLALMNHDRVVWRYRHKTDESGKPCFDPLALPDGSALTWHRPPDHPWHRAAWFCWKYINALNYWEEDRKTGRSPGRTVVTGVRIAPPKGHDARIELSLVYHPPGKPDVLTEKRIITVTAPATDGSYRVDWQGTFTAGKTDAVLRGGEHGGGYAGFSARLAKATRNWKVLNSEGLRDLAAHGKKARWVAWSGELAPGKPAGIAIFDHPGNLRHPSPWYVAARANIPFNYFSPALLFSEPYTLKAGKSMTLRYRLLVHTGRADAKAMETEWKAFSRTK